MTWFRVDAILFMILRVAQLTSGQGCGSGPCKNDALCEDRPGGYECFCVDGYAGQNCGIDFDDCVSAPCRNNGTCIDGVASYTCTCAPGFTGSECQEDIDECLSTPCLRNGTCINIVNQYACECVHPFKGDNCNLLPCDTLPCENEGLCRNDLAFNESVSGFACDCPVGYTGQRCEINIEDCDLENITSCHDNGLCVDGINDYSCLCEPGWVGEYCASPVNDCIGNECRNNANCTDRHLGYDCECPTGYDGSLCERERDECEVYNSCQNGGLCVDLFDSYRCECAAGWFGNNCTEQVNECLKNPCKNGATCIDLVGEYECRCAPFYTGTLCEILYNPCGPGYNPCQNSARCLTPPDGHYRCFCQKGFTGVHCEVDLDECFSYPCQNNATCEDITGDYICHCMLGWEGQNCELNEDDCESQPCLNDAECFDLLNEFECNCTREYTGRVCDKMRNFCEQDPCFHDGMCMSVLGDYKCLCSPPYTGRQCLERIDACISQPCANGGTCLNTLDGAVCNCPVRFTGETCDELVNFCASRPCWNGATCRNGVNGYLCVCPELFTGKQCADIIDYCKDEPCKNDAYCINGISNYRCSCLYGFTGINCTDLIDFCATKPCQNSASCSNIPGGFLCNCLPGYVGELCENIEEITSHASSSSPISPTRSIFLSSLSVSSSPSSDFTYAFKRTDISPMQSSMYKLVPTSSSIQLFTSASLVSTSIYYTTVDPSGPHTSVSSKLDFDPTTSRTIKPTQTLKSNTATNIRTTEELPSYTLFGSSLHYSKIFSHSVTDVLSNTADTSRILESTHKLSSSLSHLQSSSSFPSVSGTYITSTTSSNTFGSSDIHLSSESAQSIVDTTRSFHTATSTLELVTFSSEVEKHPSLTIKSSNVLKSPYLTEILSISDTTYLLSVSSSIDASKASPMRTDNTIRSSNDFSLPSISSTPSLFNTESTSDIHHYTNTMYKTTLDSYFTMFETLSHSDTLLRSVTQTPTHLATIQTHVLTRTPTLQTRSSEHLSSEELSSYSGTDNSETVTSKRSIHSSSSSHEINFSSTGSLKEPTSSDISTVHETDTVNRSDNISSMSKHMSVSSINTSTNIIDTSRMTPSNSMSSKSYTHKPERTSYDVSSQYLVTSVFQSATHTPEQTTYGVSSQSLVTSARQSDTHTPEQTTYGVSSQSLVTSARQRDTHTPEQTTYGVSSQSLVTSARQSDTYKPKQTTYVVSGQSSFTSVLPSVFVSPTTTVVPSMLVSHTTSVVPSMLVYSNTPVLSSLSLPSHTTHIVTSGIIQTTHLVSTLMSSSLSTDVLRSYYPHSIQSNLISNIIKTYIETETTVFTLPLSSITSSLTNDVLPTLLISTLYSSSRVHPNESQETLSVPTLSSSSLKSTKVETTESLIQVFSKSDILTLITAQTVESSLPLSVSSVSAFTLQTSYYVPSILSIQSSTLLEEFVSLTSFLYPSSSVYIKPSMNTIETSSVLEQLSRMSVRSSKVETSIKSTFAETLSSGLVLPSLVSVSASIIKTQSSVSDMSSHVSITSSRKEIISSKSVSTISQQILTKEMPSLLFTTLHSFQPSMSITHSEPSYYTLSQSKTFQLDTSPSQQMSLSKSIIQSTTEPQRRTSSMLQTVTAMSGDTTTSAMTSLSSSTTMTMSSVSATTTPPSTPCDKQVCFNSGTCREDQFGLYCDCADGFIGELCETETSVCDGFVCENGGHCSITKTTFGTQLPRCNCPLPFSGTRCNTEVIIFFPSFLGSSFLELSPLHFSSDQFNEVYVSIKTTNTDGTLFYSASDNRITQEIRPSFVHLRLLNGLPVYEFTCDGIVRATITGNRKVNTGDVYELIIRQVWPAGTGQWCSAALVANGHSHVSGLLLTVAAPQALGNLYLGAVPRYSFTDDVISATHAMDGFVGCIRNLQINNKEIDLVSMATKSMNLENCNVPICQHSPCKNGATCHSTGEEWYCSCYHGYAGTFCERKLCHTDPCYHGGTCVILEAEGDQLCLCPYNRGGVLCEEEISITVPHYSGTQFGHTSFSAYDHPHYLVEEFEGEFYMTLDDNSHLDNVVMYMGNSGPGDDGKDFMALGMHRGYLVFRFDLGSGYGELYSQKPLDLSLAYHHIKFGRNENRAWLQPDSQYNTTGRSRGPLTALNTKSMLYVGGYPNDMKTLLSEKARFKDGLKGCVYHLRFRTHDSHFIAPGSPPGHVEDGRNVMQCTISSCQDGPCHNGADCVDLGASAYCNCTGGWKGPTCLDVHTVCDVTNSCADGSTCVPMISDSYRCLCPLGKRGDYCDEAFSISDPLFVDEDSYMAFDPVFIRQETDVTLQIKPHMPDGLIFYVSQHIHSIARDFLAVIMHSGTVQLRYDVGSGVNVIRSPISIENGNWHTIQAGRNSTYGYLIVNGHRTVVMATGVMSYLDTTTEFYLGGVPRLSEVTQEAFENDPVTFHGCIRELSVNGRQYDLTEFGADHGQNIDDCDKTPCGYSVCKHGGVCTSGSGNDYECNCVGNFFGNNCEYPIECLNNTCLHGNCRVADDGGYECDCFIGWIGSSCDKELSLGTTARISQDSFVVFSDAEFHTRNKSHTYLTLMFKTRSLNGLIVWHGQTYSEEEDYLGVGLDNGRLKVVWNLGWYSSSDIMTPLRYNDGVWHTLSIDINNQHMTVSVDDNKYFSSVSGDFYDLDTQGIYYVGGFKQGRIRESTLGFFNEVLDMCVGNIRFHDSDDFIFDTASDGINIRGCD